MEEGSANLVVQRGDDIHMPEILYLQHPDDPMHPRANLDSFIAGYRKLGGTVALELFEGEAYDAVRSDPTSPSARDAVRKMVAFIHRASGI